MAKRSHTGRATIDHKPVTYQNFQPLANWSEDQENNILTVHLPGFKKEQVKLACQYSSNIIQLHGVQQLANNKWSRFDRSFTIPHNCNLGKIHTKWQHAILTIIMPKVDTTRPVSAAKVEAKPSLKSQKVEQEQAYSKPAASDGKIIDKDHKYGAAAKAKNLKEMESVAAAAMQAVNGIAMESKEERQILVNIGVAVLVLVAFGAYISYSLGSKTEEN